MPSFDFTPLREQIDGIAAGLGSGEPLDMLVVGGLLSLVIVLSLTAIWKGRRRAAVPSVAPSAASGFTRWLTPLGMGSVPKESRAELRPRRKTSGNQTIKVTTPVSRVAPRALRAKGADPRDIARRTGLARDAVVMMMANAGHAVPKSGVRSVKTAAAPTVQRVANHDGSTRAPAAFSAGPKASGLTTRGTKFSTRLG
jgi:hypothetical protein